MAFEAHLIPGITSNSRYVPFTYHYGGLPAVFGMIETSYGGDEVTVRSFNHSTTGVNVIAQESQCQGYSIIHLQGELQSLFVVGPLAVPDSQQCYVYMESALGVPTGKSTDAPTTNPTLTPYSAAPTPKPTVMPSPKTTTKLTSAAPSPKPKDEDDPSRKPKAVPSKPKPKPDPSHKIH